MTERSKCCANGTMVHDISYPNKLKLKPLQNPLLNLYKETRIMSIACNRINNILSFVATGVENDSGGGFEHDMFGPHAVKLNGRTYHMLHNAVNSTDPSNGLSYFLFDNITAIDNAAQQRDVQPNIIHEVYRYLCVHNPIALHLRILGILISLFIVNFFIYFLFMYFTKH